MIKCTIESSLMLTRKDLQSTKASIEAKETSTSLSIRTGDKRKLGIAQARTNRNHRSERPSRKITDMDQQNLEHKWKTTGSFNR